MSLRLQSIAPSFAAVRTPMAPKAAFAAQPQFAAAPAPQFAGKKMGIMALLLAAGLAWVAPSKVTAQTTIQPPSFTEEAQNVRNTVAKFFSRIGVSGVMPVLIYPNQSALEYQFTKNNQTYNLKIDLGDPNDNLVQSVSAFKEITNPPRKSEMVLYNSHEFEGGIDPTSSDLLEKMLSLFAKKPSK